MIAHPDFDPIAMQIGPLAVHWYGLTYLLAFLMFIWLGKKQASRMGWDEALVDRLLLYGMLGVILGGRLGYIIFYKPLLYLHHPLKIIALWEGGMSFHGGLLGALLAIGLLAYRTHYGFWQITDFTAPLVPPGLAAGRIGNFINGELWGKVTSPEAPWAMLFPHARTADNLYAMQHPEWLHFLSIHHALPRHPTQLYECALEGIVLFVLLHYYCQNPRKIGQVSGMFLLCYGAFRYVIEYMREPDSFMPLLWCGLSMGQWLSLPMIGIGIWLLRSHHYLSDKSSV